MADITMCNGNACSKRSNCYRYTATPNKFWQSYAAYDLNPDQCKAFWLDDERESKEAKQVR